MGMAGQVYQLGNRLPPVLPGWVRRPPPSQPCGAGVTPCGRPARLYPCGWRCDDCIGVTAAEQPDAVTGSGEGPVAA